MFISLPLDFFYLLSFPHSWQWEFSSLLFQETRFLWMSHKKFRMLGPLISDERFQGNVKLWEKSMLVSICVGTLLDTFLDLNRRFSLYLSKMKFNETTKI